MDQRIVELYDHFTHGGLSRREFLDRLVAIVGSTTAALALLPLLQNDYARAATVSPDDPRLVTETQSYGAAGTRIAGYLARLKAEDKRPAVIVVHENRGLNPHIEDIARRLALANFMAFAPDGLTSVGGYPGDDVKGGQMFNKIDKAKMAEDM